MFILRIKTAHKLESIGLVFLHGALNMKRHISFFKQNINYIVSLCIFFIFLLFGFTKMAEKTEASFYDLALRLKPEVKEKDNILLLNIDDLAIEKIGSWSWSRDILADVLIRLKELGGKTAVFDIEYLSPSLQAVNKEYIEKDLPKSYKEVREEMKEYIDAFSSSIRNESISLKDVVEEGHNMSEYLDEKIESLSTSLSSKVFKDNDSYFAKSILFFANTFLTINAVEINIEENSKEAKDFAYENLLYSNIEDPSNYIKNETLKLRANLNENYGIAPAILPLLKKAKGAGFPNVIIDNDGVRRRIPLLSEYNGKYVAQLVFAPILATLKPEKIIKEKMKLILKNVASENGTKDIIIPLDEDGNLLINWLKKPFVDDSNPSNNSFKNLSCYTLIYANILEKQLLNSLDEILSLNIRDSDGYLSYHNQLLHLKNDYEGLLEFKNQLLNEETESYNEYIANREYFFNSINEFLKSPAENELHTLFNHVIKDNETDKDTKEFYKMADEKVRLLFNNTRTFYTQYINHIENIKNICNDSFTIIGYSGVGTSDLGTNPFWHSYPNVGTHANVYNTIMTENFIKPIPKKWSILFSFIILIISALLLQKIQKGYIKIIFGFSLALLLFIFFITIFAFLNIYIPIFMPLTSTISNFILISFLSFIFTEKEKSFLRRAFAVYLSDDVVKQIVLDPSHLSLGGKAKRITALFTDIKSFSTLSEKIDPEHLVSVLNIYLTKMSDIILNEKGTIDKYIGDAIVSFFGAPLDLEDHAIRSCYAALKMKEAEEEINLTLYETGKIPMPIKTRIGINTGEMVVGNMGTEKKMNYTIMGNDVNLAARLEGVNKKYGTWILISESTWKETKGIFLARPLDRVRVVGINTPCQLYNLMAIKSEATPEMIALAESFEKAINLYRNRDYKASLKAFKECREINSDDMPTKIYIERMEALCNNPELAKVHDDIVNMTSK